MQEIEIKVNQAAITPFWRKLPFFFLFPFRFGPGVFLAVLVAASALAGLALGSFGLLAKGFLVYLGLRYAFNVLELFSRGRFEGESPDHRLWGPEKRPGKLGLVLVLFVLIGANLGSIAVANRAVNDPKVQDKLVERYRRDHADELARIEQEQQAWRQKMAKHRIAAAAGARAAAAAEADDASGSGEAAGAPSAALMADEDPPEAPEAAPGREAMIAAAFPGTGDVLWLQLQPVWFWLVMGALSLLLPSAAITIALEDSFFRALNPLNVVRLVQAMGSAYFVLWAFFLAIAGSRQVALAAGVNLPVALRFPLEMALATYLGLVLFAILGYALYQYHQELHLDVDVGFDDHRDAGGAEAIATAGSVRAALGQSKTAKDPWEQKIDQLAARGEVAEAIAEVRDRMRYDRFDVALNARLHALHLQLGDAPRTLAQGQQYLTALARAGRPRELTGLIQSLRMIEPAFQPEDGDVVLPAATAALQKGDVALATSVLRSFDRRFPQHRDTAGVFFLGARLLSEQSRQHEKAARILRAVLQQYPDHAVAGEARTYLQVLEKLLAQPATAA